MMPESLALRPEIASNNTFSPVLNMNANPSNIAISDFNEACVPQLAGLLYEIEASGAFESKDTLLALQVIKEKMANVGDYHIKIAGSEGIIFGFIIYSKAALSDSFYDLYWMAVRPLCQGRGIGKMLLSTMEADIRAKGGKSVILDTSSAEEYEAARHLYEKTGYKLILKVDNFYSEDEHKLMYRKDL